MPFSTDTAARYQDRVTEVIQKAVYETAQDFDLLVATLTPLLDQTKPMPTNQQYQPLFEALAEIRDGFDIFVGEDILTRVTVQQGLKYDSPKTQIPAFLFTATTKANKLKEAKQAYLELFETTLADELKKKSLLSAVERQRYIDSRLEAKRESKTIPPNFKHKQDDHPITHQDQLLLHLVRDYINEVDFTNLRSHAERARHIRIPGLYQLTAPARQYEYERFLMHAQHNQPGPENLFRAVEVFPGHRNEIFDRFELAIRSQAESLEHVETLYYAFPNRLPELAAKLEAAAQLQSLTANPAHPGTSLHPHFHRRYSVDLAKATLIYLKTGTYPDAPSFLTVIPADQRLSHEAASAEIHLLCQTQLFTLQCLFMKGLRGNHLRAWQPASIYERFTDNHMNALIYLMGQKNYGPTQAIQLISGKSRTDVETIYNPQAAVPAAEEKTAPAARGQHIRYINDNSPHAFRITFNQGHRFFPSTVLPQLGFAEAKEDSADSFSTEVEVDPADLTLTPRSRNA